MGFQSRKRPGRGGVGRARRFCYSLSGMGRPGLGPFTLIPNPSPLNVLPSQPHRNPQRPEAAASVQAAARRKAASIEQLRNNAPPRTSSAAAVRVGAQAAAGPSASDGGEQRRRGGCLKALRARKPSARGPPLTGTAGKRGARARPASQAARCAQPHTRTQTHTFRQASSRRPQGRARRPCSRARKCYPLASDLGMRQQRGHPKPNWRKLGASQPAHSPRAR